MSVEAEDPTQSLSSRPMEGCRGLALVFVDRHSPVEEVITADSRLRTDPTPTGACDEYKRCRPLSIARYLLGPPRACVEATDGAEQAGSRP